MSEEMKVGVMNYMLLLQSITLQITVTDPQKVIDVNSEACSFSRSPNIPHAREREEWRSGGA